MKMIETILASLLIASLAATGAFFLKWWEAKKEKDQLQADNLKMKQGQTDAEKKIAELQTYIRQHQAPYVERRVAKTPIEE